MITVKDNFFRDDLSKMITKGTETYKWSYNHKAVLTNPTHNKFFVCYLWIQPSEENFFHILWQQIHKGIPEVAGFDCFCIHANGQVKGCFRILANGQVKGQNGNWHKDHGDKTVLYFPLEWVHEWGGTTRFKFEDAETEIEYKQNRLLVFNSNVLHYGYGPAIDNVLRISIAFNLRKQT
jgi:hypothetical protein